MTFAYEEITAKAAAVQSATMLSTAGAAKGAVPVTVAAPKPAAQPATPPPDAGDKPAAVDAATGPLTSDEVAGHRIWVLLFDTSSMQPEDVQKAADAAIKWAKEKMSPADLVAVASIGSTLQILTDFTNDKDKIAVGAAGVRRHRRHRDRGRRRQHDGDRRGDERGDRRDATAVDASAQELDTFNNDIRLRGLKTICDSLLSMQQKKAILYFSSGMQRNGSDNQVELRAAVNACVRANVVDQPVDSRGLQAVVPGGSARQGSRGGVGAFSGRNVANQFAQLRVAAGDAADAGGRHGRHRVHRLERLRRGVRQGPEGHLVVLHPRLRELESRSRTAATAASRSG